MGGGGESYTPKVDCVAKMGCLYLLFFLSLGICMKKIKCQKFFGYQVLQKKYKLLSVIKLWRMN